MLVLAGFFALDMRAYQLGKQSPYLHCAKKLLSLRWAGAVFGAIDGVQVPFSFECAHM